MNTPIQRMIKVLEDIVDKELNKDKRLAYEYCVYLANTYLEDEKNAIIDAHIEGQRVFDDYPHTQWTNDQAEDYYKKTFIKLMKTKEYYIWEIDKAIDECKNFDLAKIIINPRSYYVVFGYENRLINTYMGIDIELDDTLGEETFLIELNE